MIVWSLLATPESSTLDNPTLLREPCRGDVLVVDDDPLVRRAIARTLAVAGLTVEQADDGASAVRAALARQYDVIVSDIHMPGLTGLQMLEALRGHGLDVPVVFLSGMFSPAAAPDVESVYYLTKPVDRGPLIDTIRRAMEGRRRDVRDVPPEE